MARDAAPSTVPGRRNLVVGLGRTGYSCADYLSRHGEQFAVTDSRADPPELARFLARWPDAPRYLGTLDPELATQFARLVLSPGVSRSEALVQAALAHGVPVVGDVEIFARVKRAPAVGITGTNGKSTVTALVAAMASAAGRSARPGGNFGDCVLDVLEPEEPELYVLELSSFQLESTESLELTAAAVLNVAPDHLDRYRSIEDYAAAKARIFRHCRTAVVNADDPRVSAMAPAGGPVSSFSPSGAAAEWTLLTAGSEEYLARRAGVAAEPLISTRRLRLSGRHNAGNALAALALGAAIGLPLPAMLGALESFAGLPHRTECVAERRGVRYLDDSKGTNVAATVAAVPGLSGPIVLLAGGLGKGQDFSPLAAALKDKVRHAVLIGRDAPLLAQALRTACPVEFAGDMTAAVSAAARVARSGDLVLLSPACASQDMFRDYAERGAAFAAAARALPT
jgi:UDP-N-acetylmuramoylalanine--D-glutamate ligase